MRRRSTISKLDRPGETGGDAEGGGSDAVGAFCPTLIGRRKARRARFKEEEWEVKSVDWHGQVVRRGVAESPIRPFLDCWGLFCTVQLFYRLFCALFYFFCLFGWFFSPLYMLVGLDSFQCTPPGPLLR